jgi:hypothetical protein
MSDAVPSHRHDQCLIRRLRPRGRVVCVWRVGRWEARFVAACTAGARLAFTFHQRKPARHWPANAGAQASLDAVGAGPER